MSEQLRRELASLRLVCACEDCEHFVPDGEVCDLLYPTSPHRLAAFHGARDGDPVFFCKMFEARSAPARVTDRQD